MLAQGRSEDETPTNYIIYLQAVKRGFRNGVILERPFFAQRGKLSSRRGARCAWQWDGPASSRRPRLHRSTRYLRAALLARRKIFRPHAELGRKKKGLAFVKAAAVLIADELFVMEHDFEEGTDSAELGGGEVDRAGRGLA